MPKLTSKNFATRSVEHNDDSLGAVVLDGGVADEEDCLLFEQRLNDWVDLRCEIGEISQDAHVVACADCQTLLDDYQAMLEATEQLGVLDDVGAQKLRVANRAQSSGQLPTDSTRGQIFGWSTLLALLFLFLGAPRGNLVDSSVSEFSLVSGTNTQGELTELFGGDESNGLSFSELSSYPSDLASHLVSVNPLVQSAPASCQTFFEMPTGRLLAAGLPAVDLEAVDMNQLNHIGQYWQHASKLPGIEPWQHSVSFAIGWYNQPAMPIGNPQCG